MGFDEVVPPAGSQWKFTQEVADVFENMLERSIPELDGMRDVVTRLACKFALPNTQVIDLGCSAGGSLIPIIREKGRTVSYIGVENSVPMIEKAEELIGALNVDYLLQNMDLRSQFPQADNCSVILSVLTLQFIPMEHRQSLLHRVISSLNSGGAFVLVEKVLGNDHFLNDLMTTLYQQMKRDNGYSEVQIAEKKRSLENALVPVSARSNEELLRSAGFKHVECIWRNLQFVGWIAVKG